MDSGSSDWQSAPVVKPCRTFAHGLLLPFPLTRGAQLGRSWTSACVDAIDTNLTMTSDLRFRIESANPHAPAGAGRLHFRARSDAAAQSNERVKGSSTLT